MRTLTPAEATVVALLLARSEPAIHRTPLVTLPHRRTIQEVRKRARGRGWISERFVPSPAALGSPQITFALAHPPAERLVEEGRRWAALPGAVLVWISSEGIFGVFWGPGAAALGPENGSSRTAGPAGGATMVLSTTAAGLPVYFDYELAWARATGLPGVSPDCPRSIPSPAARGPEGALRLASAAQREAIRSMVEATSIADRPAPLGIRFGLAERCRRNGWASFRTFLEPSAIIESVDGFPEWMAFVTGQLAPGTDPADLYETLVMRAHVSPFLFASDGRQVLFASLARDPGARADPGRAPVLPAIHVHLDEVTVSNWPLRSFHAVLDHDYRRVAGIA